jgi:MFS family permease
LKRALVALTYRDFRILWLGAFASTIGTWTQKVAQSWLVLDLTQSSFYLGLDEFLAQAPILLFTVLGGVIADRHDRRRLLMASQYVQMASAFTLALLVWTGTVRIEHVLALSFLTGFGQAFGGPAYQSLVPSLVKKEHLPSAIALNSIQFNLSRIFGALFAGATIALLGTAICFALNGLSYAIVVAALFSLSVRHLPPLERKSMAEEMRGGFRYVRGEPALLTLIAIAFVTTFFGLPLITLLPVFARDIFQGDIGLFSRMMVFVGAGSVLGALVVAARGRFKHMALTLLLIELLFGVLIVGFSLSRTLWLSELVLFLAGAAMMMVTATATSLVQLIVPDHLRGRVVSIFMVAFRGGMPLGALASGYAASLVGTAPVVLVNGIIVSAAALCFLVTSHKTLARA